MKGNWSGESAFNLPLALQESRQWIEAVVGQKFVSDDFQLSLKNGILLCKYVPFSLFMLAHILRYQQPNQSNKAQVCLEDIQWQIRLRPKGKHTYHFFRCNSLFCLKGNLVDFIKACKQLGLRDAQIFDPNDLFEAQRLRNVCYIPPSSFLFPPPVLLLIYILGCNLFVLARASCEVHTHLQRYAKRV